MIFPIGDSPNPEGKPVVTSTLIAINVAVYVYLLPLMWQAPDLSDPRLAEYIHLIARETGYRLSNPQILASVSAYDMFVFKWGYRPVDPSLLSLIVSMFLHGGLAHLLGNMIFLWIYGDNVEHRLGRFRFAACYLLTGIAATLFHAMFFPTSGLPLVGASGAISGVLGFYFLWYPHNRVHLLVLVPFLVRLSVPARTLLGLYIVVENIFPFVLSRGAAGVAYGAHIGGFLAGLAIARIIDRRELVRQPPEYARAAAREAAGRNDLRAALAERRYDDAARAYFALPADAARRALSGRELLTLGDWLLANGEPRAALIVYRRYLRNQPRGPGAARAHVGAGLVQLHHLQQPTAAYQHFLDALDCDPDPETSHAAREGLQSIEARQPPLRAVRT